MIIKFSYIFICLFLSTYFYVYVLMFIEQFSIDRVL